MLRSIQHVLYSGQNLSYGVKAFCCKNSSRIIRATYKIILSDSESESLPTNCTISCKSSSRCKIYDTTARRRMYYGSKVLKNGSNALRYLEYEISQLTDGKCFRCANRFSRPQKTCTMPNVADVTGSEKSPPGGETAPTIVTDP